MPILTRIQRRSLKGRLIVAAFYLFLTCGAIWMVYPFLLMVSGSMKTEVDRNQLNIIPRFLFSRDALFAKFEEQRYGRAEIAAMMTRARDTAGNRLYSFAPLRAPSLENKARMADWESFLGSKQAEWPAYFQSLGHLYANRAVSEVSLMYREAIRKAHPDASRKDWDTPLMPEEWWNPSYHAPAGHYGVLYWKMRQSLPPRYFFPISVEGIFATQAVLPVYGAGSQGAERLSKEWNRPIGSLLDVTLSAVQPANLKEREIWSDFVKNILSSRFIAFPPALLPSFLKFLEGKYGNLESLNRTYDGNFQSWNELAFPTSASRPAAFIDATAFLRSLDDLTGIRILSPDYDWRAFLRERYENNLEALNQRWGASWQDFASIPMPLLEYDAALLQKYRGEIVRELITRNYRVAWSILALSGQGLRNTAIFCLLNVVAALIINPLCAYALSRYRLRWSQAILFFLMATMAFPGEITQIPSFLLLRDMGWLNTFAALVIPSAANGYTIFLLKGFFDSLPDELYEAASLDGCGELRTFFIITLPLSAPILAVVALGAFISAYGAFMFALLVCQKESMWTVMVYIYQMQQSYSSAIIFAALVITAIPTLLVFILCQNVIMRGIVIPVEK